MWYKKTANEPKHCLLLCLKGIASKYEDVIAMVPLIKLHSSVLLFTDVMHPCRGGKMSCLRLHYSAAPLASV